jgi:hypothetical protein
VLQLRVIVLFGLLLHVEKDKRMRLHDDYESSFDEEVPSP